MRGLTRVGSIGDTAVRVHWSTWLLPLGVLAYGYYRGVSAAGLAWWQLFLAAVLLCVFLHELGHAYAARLFGVRVHDIILLPIGGAARLERLPARPRDEALVALAGPLVNLGIALLLAPALLLWPRADWLPWLNNYDARAGVATLALFNFAVFAFNLLPAFPLDGGRVMRATLNAWMPRLRATRITSWVARAVALAGFAYGVYAGSFFAAGFAAYVFVLAGREVRVARVRDFLDGGTLGEFALPLRVFHPEEPIDDVRRHLERNGQRGAVIADECSPIGFATLDMLRDLDPGRHVGDLELLSVMCHDSSVPLRALSIQFAKHPRSVAIEEIDARPAGFLDLELLEQAFQRHRAAGG